MFQRVAAEPGRLVEPPVQHYLVGDRGLQLGGGVDLGSGVGRGYHEKREAAQPLRHRADERIKPAIPASKMSIGSGTFFVVRRIVNVPRKMIAVGRSTMARRPSAAAVTPSTKA